MTLIALHEGDHEAKIRSDQSLDRDVVALACLPRQRPLLLNVGDHREVLDVPQILLEGLGRAERNAGTGWRRGGTTRHGRPNRRGTNCQIFSGGVRKVRSQDGVFHNRVKSL